MLLMLVVQSSPTLCDPWTAARQASLSLTISRSLLKLMSTESMMSSNHLILCCPLHLLPSIFPTISVFSNELALHIRLIRKPQSCHQSEQRLTDPARPPGRNTGQPLPRLPPTTAIRKCRSFTFCLKPWPESFLPYLFTRADHQKTARLQGST